MYRPCILLHVVSRLLDLCLDIKCEHGARCEEGACLCPTDCPFNEELLCGSDLMTVRQIYIYKRAFWTFQISLFNVNYDFCSVLIVP